MYSLNLPSICHHTPMTGWNYSKSRMARFVVSKSDGKQWEGCLCNSNILKLVDNRDLGIKYRFCAIPPIPTNCIEIHTPLYYLAIQLAREERENSSYVMIFRRENIVKNTWRKKLIQILIYKSTHISSIIYYSHS